MLLRSVVAVVAFSYWIQSHTARMLLFYGFGGRGSMRCRLFSNYAGWRHGSTTMGTFNMALLQHSLMGCAMLFRRLLPVLLLLLLLTLPLLLLLLLIHLCFKLRHLLPV